MARRNKKASRLGAAAVDVDEDLVPMTQYRHAAKTTKTTKITTPKTTAAKATAPKSTELEARPATAKPEENPGSKSGEKPGEKPAKPAKPELPSIYKNISANTQFSHFKPLELEYIENPGPIIPENVDSSDPETVFRLL
jgi:hypothetical protein